MQCLKTHYFGLLVYTPIIKLAHVTNLFNVNKEKVLLGLGVVKAFEIHIQFDKHFRKQDLQGIIMDIKIGFLMEQTSPLMFLCCISVKSPIGQLKSRSN
jgi:hypothetical protein